MQVTELKLPGLKLIKPRVFPDERGYFFETYQYPRFQEAGIPTTFLQDNHSVSSKGTLRGMHFQSHPGQDKLVNVLYGEIFDCVVDMRANSPTFKQWYGVFLNDENHHQLYIPHGFAHGFCVTSEKAYVCYKVSNIYDPKTEKDFRYDDSEINIQWPIDHPKLSERDLRAPSFSEALNEMKEKISL